MHLPQSGDVALPSTFPDRLEKSFELTIKLDVLLVEGSFNDFGLLGIVFKAFYDRLERRIVENMNSVFLDFK